MSGRETAVAASAPPAAAPAATDGAPAVRPVTCTIPEPTYPPLSKRRGESGKVVIRLIVAPSGAIESAAVRQSSGFARLDAAARDAVLAGTCRPYLQDGRPVRAAADKPYTFALED